MKKQTRTREQLANELEKMRQRIAELEKAKSQRKRAEDTRRSSEETVLALLNAPKDPSFLLDVDGYVLALNQAAADIHGKPVDEMVGTNIYNSLPAELAKLRRRYQERVVRSKQPFRTEESVGEASYYTTVYPVLDDKGKVRGVAVYAQDITERKRAEEALRQSEERLSGILDSLQAGVVIIDAETHVIVDANPAAIEAIGSTKEMIVGNVCHKFICPTEKGQCPITDLGKTVDKSERVLINASGENIPILKSVTNTILNGRLHLIESFVDFTERKRAEERLRESEERFRSLLENAPYMIFIADREGKILFVNYTPAGFTVEDTVGTSVFDYVPAEHREEMSRNINGVFESGEPTSYEIIGAGPQGTTSWYFTRVGPIKHDGHIIAVTLMVLDITERKLAEEALKESEERYKAIFNRSLYSVYLHDFEGNFLDANETALDLLGYTREEIPSINFARLLDEEQIAKALKTLDEVKRTGSQEKTIDFKLRRKDGDYVWVETESALIYREGKPYAIQGIAKDITERKRAEEELRKSEEKYRLLIDNLIEPLTVYDSKGRILLINVTGAKNLGSTPEDVVGKSLYDFFPDTADVYVERARRIFESGVGLEFEDEVPLPSGNRWFYSNIQPVKDTSGKVISVQNISYEITERKRAEEELRESEERYRTVLETIEEGYYEVDIAGNFTFFNDSLCRIVGISRDEMMGTNNRQYMDDKTAKAVYETFNLVYRTGEPARAFVWEVIRKDGTRIFVEASTSLMHGPSGEPVGFRGIIRDISERKRAEEALKASEEKLHAMFESITDGIVVTDLQGKITEVNDVVLRMSGLSREEIIGKDGFALVPREDRDKIVEEGKRAIKEETGPVRMEHEISPKVGSAQTMNLVLGTMHDSDGNPTGFVAIAQDITERKRAEEALKASEEKLRVMFESITDGIVVTDLQGIITEVNDMIVQMTGLSREELVGKDAFALIPRKERDKIMMDMTHTLEEGDALGVRSYTLKAKDGSEFNTEFSTAVLRDSSGNIINFVGVARDVTERKRAEQERERLLAELEDKSQELEQLVFISSHDLRSPLVNIQGFAREIEQSLRKVRLSLEEEDVPSALKEKLASPIDEDIADSLNYILSSSSKIDSMLTGLLKLSRLGRVTLTIEKINMKDLIAEVVDSFKFQTREAGVKLEVGRLPQCWGDRAQLNQVFSNLIDNALKFLDPKRPGIIRISGRKEKSQVVYTVEDNGVGIAPEHHKTVFQIFRRFSPMDTPGEGLGLNIVRRILDGHGGKIWLESEPGKGSRFHVSLPIRD